MRKNKALRNSDILYHIIKGWRIILLFTLIGLVVGVVIIGAGYIRGEVSREYQISSSFAIITPKQNAGSSAASNDSALSRSITETSMYIIKSQKNLEAVVEHLGLRGVSANDISRNLSVTRYNETEVVELKLLWRSEKEGLTIMDAINEVSASTIRDAIKTGGVSVINPPKASFIVGGNISISTWIYAALIGLLAGVGVCILRFLIMPTLINEIDITTLFGISTLGSLPLDKRYARSKPNLKSPLEIMDDIKSVSHLLLNRLETSDAHRLYVTSTRHGEGKTRLAADIALQFSRLGKKTLLIDCDLANPRLGALFFDNLEYEQTLNSLYRGDSDVLDAIVHINGCLDILPTALERNPESLNDPLLEVIERAMNGYDYVIIDAAPVGVDAEALRLNEIVDAVLYVIRFDFARLDDIKRSMQRISKSNVPVAGAVFNCTVNWRQTIINAPKRLASSLKREEKRKNKEKERSAGYKELRSKENKKPETGNPVPSPSSYAESEAKKTESRNDKKVKNGKKGKTKNKKSKNHKGK